MQTAEREIHRYNCSSRAGARVGELPLGQYFDTLFSSITIGWLSVSGTQSPHEAGGPKEGGGDGRRRRGGCPQAWEGPMACVTVWKQPYAPGDPALGTFPLERVAEMTGLTPLWLGFVLLNAERATGVWDT